MTRLIVTTDSSIAGAIQQAGLADLVIAIERRLVWDQLPFDAVLLRGVRCRPYPGWRRGHFRSTCTTMLSVTCDISTPA